MNIFALDNDFEVCAHYHCDKHIVKMMIEYVQLLSNAMTWAGLKGPYKPTHKNHPCTIWVRQSKQNYQWLWDLANCVGIEYTRRYHKTHLSHTKLIQYCPYCINLPDIGLTRFVNCTTHKNIPNVIEAYRMYYKTDKMKFATWKNGDTPQWIK